MDERTINFERTLSPGNDGPGEYVLAVGDVLGQYRVVRPLGRGGMGEVYEVEHEVLRRRYALKLLPAELAQNSVGLERFRREAQVMANLEHPNIVRVDEFGETDGRYWLRMELAEGVEVAGQRVNTLGEYVAAKNKKLSAEEAVAIFTEILEGLAHAHGKGVVHRDLKPGNILLSLAPDGGLHLKISDFGLVRLVGEDWVRSQAELSVRQSMSTGGVPTLAEAGAGSGTRSLLGTYEYMSPEQKRGEEATTASDVYAVGLMAYRLLTGKQLGPRPPSHHVADLPEWWDELVLTALEEDPAKRFADADEMLRKLWDGGTGRERARDKHLGEAAAEAERTKEPTPGSTLPVPAPQPDPDLRPPSPGRSSHDSRSDALPPPYRLEVPDTPRDPPRRERLLWAILHSDWKRFLPWFLKCGVPVGAVLLWSIFLEGVVYRITATEHVVGGCYLGLCLLALSFSRLGRRRWLCLLPVVAFLGWRSIPAWYLYDGKPPVMNDFVKVAAGQFTMGSDGKDAERDETPHHVTLTRDYWLSRYEITNRWYKAFVESTGYPRSQYWASRWYGLADQPVVAVSWDDAVAFCEWLTERERAAGRLPDGYEYRLPTEAEWEYAARGGTNSKGFTYSGSNDLKEVGWYGDNSGRKPHPVGQKKPNELGLYDMSGNVYEWCRDWYGGYPSGAVTDPTGARTGQIRVRRGGSWCFNAGDCRAAYRIRYVPTDRNLNLGFRVALGPVQ